MAEETDKLIYLVEFNSADAEKNAERLKGGVKAYRTELEATHKEYKDGTITQDEYNKSVAAIVPQLNKAEQQYKAVTKAMSDNKRLEAEQAGSLMQSAVAIELMTDKLRGRNAAYLDSKAGKDEIANLQRLKKEYDDNSEKITKTKKSVSDLIKEQNFLGVNIGQVSDSFKNGTSGIGTFTKSIFTTRGALVALGAVPIVLFLTLLTAFFKSTDEGSDRLAQGIAFLTAGFDSLLKGIAPLGKLLVDLFTSPIDTVKKITRGTDDYNVSLKGIAKSAYEAAEAHRLYTKRMQDVEDNENALIAQRERVGLQVDQAILKAKDLSLTHQQRIDILREAGKAEAELAEKTKKNAFDAYVNRLAENITIQRSRKLTDDELKAQL